MNDPIKWCIVQPIGDRKYIIHSTAPKNNEYRIIGKEVGGKENLDYEYETRNSDEALARQLYEEADDTFFEYEDYLQLVSEIRSEKGYNTNSSSIDTQGGTEGRNGEIPAEHSIRAILDRFRVDRAINFTESDAAKWSISDSVKKLGDSSPYAATYQQMQAVSVERPDKNGASFNNGRLYLTEN